MAESILGLPQTFDNLQFSYKLDGKAQQITLNTEDAMRRMHYGSRKAGHRQAGNEVQL